MNKRQMKKEYRKAQTKVLLLSEVNSSLRFQLRGRAHQMQLMAQEYHGYKAVMGGKIWLAKTEATQYKEALDRAQAEKLKLAEEEPILPEDLKWMNDTPLWLECAAALSAVFMMFVVLALASLW